MKDPGKLTIADVEKALKTPASKWHGRCFEIAYKIVQTELVKGVAVYGHYLGEIAPTGWWKHRRGSVFVHHGWIALDESDDGRILDPTRWSFEDKPPYLYLHNCADHEYTCTCGHVEDEHERGFFRACTICDCPDLDGVKCSYDEGGNDLRAMMRRPCPAYNSKAKRFVLEMRAEALDFVTYATGHPSHLTIDHLFWLANLPLQDLGPYALDLFEALKKIGKGALVPVDNLNLVYRKAGRVAELSQEGSP